MKTHKKDTHWLVGVAMMAAIVVLLANTPLGLINIPPIKATTIHIPVIVGAILLGPMAGGVLGGVFGICSVISNTIAPVPASICFSPVLAVSVGGALGAVKALWVAVGGGPLLLIPILAAGGALGAAGLRWQLGGRDWLSLAVCIEGAAVLLLGGGPAMAAGRVAAGVLLAILAAWTPVAEPTAAAGQLPAKE